MNNLDIKELFKNEIDNLKKQYPDKDVENEVENAFYIYLGLKQEFEKETFNSYEKNWIKRCASELLERDADTRNVASYAENGYSVSYFESFISLDLRREIFPKVGTIK